MDDVKSIITFLREETAYGRMTPKVLNQLELSKNLLKGLQQENFRREASCLRTKSNSPKQTNLPRNRGVSAKNVQFHGLKDKLSNMKTYNLTGSPENSQKVKQNKSTKTVIKDIGFSGKSCRFMLNRYSPLISIVRKYSSKNVVNQLKNSTYTSKNQDNKEKSSGSEKKQNSDSTKKKQAEGIKHDEVHEPSLNDIDFYKTSLNSEINLLTHRNTKADRSKQDDSGQHLQEAHVYVPRRRKQSTLIIDGKKGVTLTAEITKLKRQQNIAKSDEESIKTVSDLSHKSSVHLIRPIYVFQNVCDSVSEEEHELKELIPSWFSINPKSNFSEIWAILYMLLACIVLVLYPVLLIFIRRYNLSQSHNQFNSFEIFVDIFFILNICIKLITGVSVFSQIYYSFSMIFGNYLTHNNLVLDILTSIPFSVAKLIFNSEQYDYLMDYSYLTKMLLIFQITKWVQIKYIYQSKNKFLEMTLTKTQSPSIMLLMKISSMAKSFVFVITFFFILSHICCCLFIYIGLSEWLSFNHYRSISWIETNEIYDKSLIEIYFNGLYFVFATFFTVGYGDIIPSSSLERLYVIMLLMISCFMYSYLLITGSNIFKNTSKKKEDISRKIDIFEDLCSDFDISSKLRTQIRTSILHYDLNSNNDFFDFLESLPNFVRNELCTKMYLQRTERMAFFKSSSTLFILYTVPLLRLHNYMKGDTIFSVGESIDEMIMVYKGKIAMRLGAEFNNFIVGHLNENEHYGEINMFEDSPASKLDICVRSNSSKIFSLKHKNFLMVKEAFSKEIDILLDESLKFHKKLEQKRILAKNYYLTFLTFRGFKLFLLSKAKNTSFNDLEINEEPFNESMLKSGIIYGNVKLDNMSDTEASNLNYQTTEHWINNDNATIYPNLNAEDKPSSEHSLDCRLTLVSKISDHITNPNKTEVEPPIFKFESIQPLNETQQINNMNNTTNIADNNSLRNWPNIDGTTLYKTIKLPFKSIISKFINTMKNDCPKVQPCVDGQSLVDDDRFLDQAYEAALNYSFKTKYLKIKAKTMSGGSLSDDDSEAQLMGTVLPQNSNHRPPQTNKNDIVKVRSNLNTKGRNSKAYSNRSYYEASNKELSIKPILSSLKSLYHINRIKELISTDRKALSIKIYNKCFKDDPKENDEPKALKKLQIARSRRQGQYAEDYCAPNMMYGFNREMNSNDNLWLHLRNEMSQPRNLNHQFFGSVYPNIANESCGYYSPFHKNGILKCRLKSDPKVNTVSLCKQSQMMISPSQKIKSRHSYYSLTKKIRFNDDLPKKDSGASRKSSFINVKKEFDKLIEAQSGNSKSKYKRRATKMLQRNIQISNVLTDNRNAQDFLQDMLNEKKGSLEKRINRNTKLKEELHNEISKRRKAHKKKLLPNLRSIKSQTLKNKNLESGKG